MHSLLNGKYEYNRLSVENIFYLNLNKRDFKVTDLIGVFSVQTILKD
jgi:hypothetical protein